MGEGALDAEVAADDSLKTGATTRARRPLSLSEQDRAVPAADAWMACHGSRPKYRWVLALVSAAAASPPAGAASSGEPTGCPSVNNMPCVNQIPGMNDR